MKLQLFRKGNEEETMAMALLRACLASALLCAAALAGASEWGGGFAGAPGGGGALAQPYTQWGSTRMAGGATPTPNSQIYGSVGRAGGAVQAQVPKSAKGDAGSLRGNVAN